MKPKIEPSPEPLRAVSTTARATWHAFLEVYEPLRPQLYRYCRALTRSPWDADDLAQDTMARAFVTLAQMIEPPPNPRAWLFRVASNLWIDTTRRTRSAARAIGPALATETSEAPEPRATREAAGTLLSALSPQERAAVALKDVFDFSLEEIAEALGTTVGAVKAALHRGRGKLAEPEPSAAQRAPVPAVLDAFCDAFNAHDVERLTALLLDTASVEVVGATVTYRDDRILQGMLFGTERMAEAATRGGIEAHLADGVLPVPPRAEVHIWRDEPIVVLFYAHTTGEHVRAINRVDVEEGRIARLRNYFFTPDVIAEICGELGLSSHSNGYRWWLTGSCEPA